MRILRNCGANLGLICVLCFVTERIRGSPRAEELVVRSLAEPPVLQFALGSKLEHFSDRPMGSAQPYNIRGNPFSGIPRINTARDIIGQAIKISELVPVIRLEVSDTQSQSHAVVPSMVFARG